MTTTQPMLNDPDKLGLLVQCRQKMDKLKINDFKSFLVSTTDILSINQLRKILFIGLNATKKELKYDQLFQIKSRINQIIEKEKKLKVKSNKNERKTTKQSVIPSIPKNASFSEVIPFDIISNNICKYLKMASITKLARCDRKLSIICHTPISITNLMHRYDPYKYYPTNTQYVIDGEYEWNDLNIHRIKNIQQLSIRMDIDSQIERKLNMFNKVKYLSFYDYCSKDDHCSWNINVDDMKLMPSLQSISFSDFEDLPFILSFFEKYKNNSNDSGSNKFYNDIIYEIQSISFINCQFGMIQNYEDVSDEDKLYKQYENMLHLILPTTTNNLEVLKIENSYFDAAIDPDTNDINDEFKNTERIKSSLSNLKGFVYSSPPIHLNDSYQHNIFSDISSNILIHLPSFKKLKSLHIHCENEQFMSSNISNIRIKELCMSLTMNQNGKSKLTQIRNNMNDLNKLCLVIDLLNGDDAVLLEFVPFIQLILEKCRKLKLLQIVMIIKDDEMNDDNNNDYDGCGKYLGILQKFIKKFIKSFQELTNHHNHSELFASNPLIFKFHIKSCHYDFKSKCKIKKYQSAQKFDDLGNMIQSMVMNYLLSYPMGQIQFKFTWNVEDCWMISRKIGYPLKGLNGLFDVDNKKNGSISHLGCDTDDICYCYNETDYRQFVISARKKNLNQDIEYEKQWLVDCQYCCNTPWV